LTDERYRYHVQQAALLVAGNPWWVKVSLAQKSSDQEKALRMIAKSADVESDALVGRDIEFIVFDQHDVILIW
jgi:hypothetical protein